MVRLAIAAVTVIMKNFLLSCRPWKNPIRNREKIDDNRVIPKMIPVDALNENSDDNRKNNVIAGIITMNIEIDNKKIVVEITALRSLSIFCRANSLFNVPEYPALTMVLMSSIKFVSRPI